MSFFEKSKPTSAGGSNLEERHVSPRDRLSGKIGASRMRRIEDAVEKLASRGLPYVWVGEPEWVEGEGPVGLKVDYLSLERLGFSDTLRGDRQTEFLEEALHVLAARRGLVTVTKQSPSDGITIEDAYVINSVKRPNFWRPGGYYRGVIESVGRAGFCGVRGRFREVVEVESTIFDDGECVTEGTVVVLTFPPDRLFPLEEHRLYRFVPLEKLVTGHLPFIESTFHRAKETIPPVCIEDTEQVRLVVDVLGDLDSI